MAGHQSRPRTLRLQEQCGKVRKNARASQHARAEAANPKWVALLDVSPSKARTRGPSLRPSTWALPNRVADKKFWLVAGGAIGSSLLVTAGTNHCRHTVGVGRCIGSDGEFKATQGIQIGLSGLVTGLGYWWKKSDQETHEKHPRWWGFPVTAIAVNTFMALDQFSKRCPRGTLFDGHNCK